MSERLSDGRTCIIRLRVRPAEKERLERAARHLQYPSVAAYVRYQVAELDSPKPKRKD